MSGAGPRLERLDTHHDLSSFDCGNTGLNAWLVRHALAAQRMDSARTFLLVETGMRAEGECLPLSVDGEHPIGYFSLTMGSVRRKDAPARLVRGMPGYPVGMVLLARLAVDRTQQGRGFGGLLLAEALRKAVAAGENAAARLLVVDAVDDVAAAFYGRWGFIEAPEQPLRLYRRLSDIRASLPK
ncbi:MAG TPA: GNAT family N-acetyltransferase [Solirubrobacteraceae bacterium]